MGDLKKKAKKGFDPRKAYGEPAATGNNSSISIGPKEQIIKLDQSVKGRGTGTVGATIGKAKPKKSFAKSTGSMTAGRSRSRGR
jgi:hypothetical protein